MNVEVHAKEDLIVGRWYALITHEYDGDPEVNAQCRAIIAEYIGDGEFVDEDEHSFFADRWDAFILQN